MIPVQRWNEADQRPITSYIASVDELPAILAEDIRLLGNVHGGNPSVLLRRPDGTTLSIATDGTRALLVWFNTLEESAHSVGDGDGPEIIYDYFGSYSEAPAGWFVPANAAITCVRNFIDRGAPDSDQVLFVRD